MPENIHIDRTGTEYFQIMYNLLSWIMPSFLAITRYSCDYPYWIPICIFF